MIRDVRHSIRLFARTPAFSLTAVVVLALGIGTNAAVFGVVNMLWFRPLPGANEPGRVVGIYTHDPTTPDSYRAFSYADYEDIRDRAAAFDHVMAHRSFSVGLTEGESARRTKAALVTGNYFATLGVHLAAGRSFSLEEERPGSRASVVVLSFPYWQRLGSPQDILGRTILVNALGEARDGIPMNWLVRSAGRTFGALGVIALFMAAIGLYGVKAHLVARRTREFGIRLAIGATTGDVIRMVLKEGAVLLVLSITVGFMLAIGVGQAVSSLLVGVRAFDPLVLSVATLVLSAAVMAACYVPARRATRVSPMTALRIE